MTPRALPDRLVPAAPPRCVERPVDMVDGYKPLEERTRPTFPMAGVDGRGELEALESLEG